MGTRQGDSRLSDDANRTVGATDTKPPPNVADVPTTKMLAIGRLTEAATPEARGPIMPAEVRATVRLHLAGKVDQWFFRTDGSGVVFHINTTDPAEARSLLDRLPLRMAGMMEFELIPLGPLRALGFLLTEPAAG